MRFKPAFVLATLLAGCVANATAADLGGTYDCSGQDGRDGDFSAVLTLSRNAEHSADGHDSYALTLEVAKGGHYKGAALVRGRTLAMSFALDGTDATDRGVGLGTVSYTRAGQARLRKFYFEPEYKGGNHGFEDCTRRK